MIEIINMFELFCALLSISFLGILLYCLAYKRTSIAYLVALGIAAFILLRYVWFAWVLSPLMLLPFFKKMRYEFIMMCCMLPAIPLAYFLLELFSTSSIPFIGWIALFTAVIVCAFGILGVFENDIRKYLFYSNTLQIFFVLLDLSVGAAAGKLDILGAIQILNYTIAGLLFFLSIGIISRNGMYMEIDKLEGRYYSDKKNAACSIISGLSLVGLPGLNIFVSEFFLFAIAFEINPLISILGVFAALILFIMYFKIPYVLLVGREQPTIKTSKTLTMFNIALCFACIILGIFPQLQIFLLTEVFI